MIHFHRSDVFFYLVAPYRTNRRHRPLARQFHHADASSDSHYEICPDMLYLEQIANSVPGYTAPLLSRCSGVAEASLEYLLPGMLVDVEKLYRRNVRIEIG